MTVSVTVPQPFSQRLQAGSRRFLHWLTKPQVILSLIMLVIMFYMVIIPLYKLLETTVTWQLVDESRVAGAVEGELTLYHWIRMFTGIFAQIYTLTPLQHSFTIAIGTVLLAGLIGGSLAWLVVRTDLPGRKLINQLAVLPYIMPSWTLAQAWLVLFKNRTQGGAPGLFEFIVGQSLLTGYPMARCRSSSAWRYTITRFSSFSYQQH
jgi:iron(III) transport system permease protein